MMTRPPRGRIFRFIAISASLGFMLFHLNLRIRYSHPLATTLIVISDKNHRRLSEDRPDEPLRVLYTITTLAEYDTGSRATTKGDDRMQKVLIPVMTENVNSLLERGYHVDVFIVAHFQMTREYLLREALHPSVGLTVWDDASPISYDPGKRDQPDIKLRNNTLGLARQHRFVVRDNLFHYDLFMCFEDDMIVKGGIVQNHLEITKKLFKLRETAPENVDHEITRQPSGPLTKDQLRRIIPGVARVEVLVDETRFGAQRKLDPVPVHPHEPLDVSACCHLNISASEKRPASPSSNKVFIWETGIEALGVRYIPSIGYVAFLRGPKARPGEDHLQTTDYWAGSDKKYFEGRSRPRPGDFKYINNQGGWMGTREQIWDWHTQVCDGGFLPPYESPHFNHDGLDPRNVEWWSGAMSLSTPKHACNMHRIVSLDPDRFTKHLVYHSANNKQRQLQRDNQRFVKVDNLYGQLLTVQKNYEAQWNPKVNEDW